MIPPEASPSTTSAPKPAARFRGPFPADDFVAYGCWFASQLDVEIDPRRVGEVRTTADGFEVQLEDGEQVTARRVVVATGIEQFTYRPPMFEHLPADLATHAYDYGDLSRWKDRSVAVIGGGQALDRRTPPRVRSPGRGSGRRPEIRWLQRSLKLHQSEGMLRRLLYPPTASVRPY